MNIKHKVGTAIATASLMAVAFAPVAYADNEVVIEGNGANSTSNVEITDKHMTVVEQTSATVVVNEISNTANTGGNSISGTTGDDSTNSITSGDAKGKVNVSVVGGNNTAEVASCGCDDSSSVTVKGNGKKSSQSVVLNLKNKLKVLQGSVTESLTSVSNIAKTGKNKVKNTTGSSSNTIESGVGTSTVDVVVAGGSNDFNPSL